MARNKLGPIPDDHFENEPTYPPKNVTPLTEKEIELLAIIGTTGNGALRSLETYHAPEAENIAFDDWPGPIISQRLTTNGIDLIHNGCVEAGRLEAIIHAAAPRE